MMDPKLKDSDHFLFYNGLVTDTNAGDDPCRKALLYALGLTEETRRHVRELYDFKERCIIPEGLDKPWQTGSSTRVTRLAFNLYNGFADANEPSAFTPYDLFCDPLQPYMLEAVRLRYAEYTGR